MQFCTSTERVANGDACPSHFLIGNRFTQFSGAGPDSNAGIGACFLPTDCCCFCYEPACCGNGQSDIKSRTGKESTQTEPVAEIIGQRGITLTPLSPSGIIIINNQRHSASSDHGYIEAGKDVIVINVAPYGLIVETLDNEN